MSEKSLFFPMVGIQISVLDVNMNAVGILRCCFCEMEKLLYPGTMTLDLESRVLEILNETNAVGYFKGYYGYPNIISVPINEEVVHTPPSSRMIRDGDIVTIELGVQKDDAHAFKVWTYPIGNVDWKTTSLLQGAHAALLAGVNEVRYKAPVSFISESIHDSLQSYKLQPSQDFVGYRIGHVPVMNPKIPCFFNKRKHSASERQPLGNLVILVVAHSGKSKITVKPDGWTVVAKDRKRSAVFSHMVSLSQSNRTVLTDFH
ncbi:MAG: M24 family metallopeptidase [Planctomycetota bacterium]